MADKMTSQLVNQMIHFTEEDLPAEWQPAWEAMEKWPNCNFLIPQFFPSHFNSSLA